jgi:hypothetical protein
VETQIDTMPGWHKFKIWLADTNAVSKHKFEAKCFQVAIISFHGDVIRHSTLALVLLY